MSTTDRVYIQLLPAYVVVALAWTWIYGLAPTRTFLFDNCLEHILVVGIEEGMRNEWRAEYFPSLSRPNGRACY